MKDVPQEDLAIQPLQEEQTINTLGLLWDPKAANLRFKAAILINRKVMSFIAQSFDPLGLLGPVIAKAKLFRQRLYALKQDGVFCEWDSPVPEKLQHEWKPFQTTLPIPVPRLVLSPGGNSIRRRFIHCVRSLLLCSHVFGGRNSCSPVDVKVKGSPAVYSSFHRQTRTRFLASGKQTKTKPWGKLI